MIGELRHKLIGKALLTLLGVTAIGALVIALALYLKGDLKRNFDLLVGLQRQEHVLQLASLTTGDLLFDLTLPQGGEAPSDALLAEWDAHLAFLVETEKRMPAAWFDGGRRPTFERAMRELAALRAATATRARVEEFVSRLGPALRAYNLDLQSRLDELRGDRLERAEGYERASDTHAVRVLVAGLVGFLAAGLLVGLFFTRLVGDLQRLEHRAKRIMTGDYGKPLAIDRKDEVGALAQSIDTMAEALANREQEMERFRRRLFQQEKMFAVGTFAAGIAHDVGNPVQALSALCRRVKQDLADDHGEEKVARHIRTLDLAIEEANRLSLTLSEISDFTRPDATDMQATDVNEVINSTVRLLRFDPRFQGITLTTELSSELPMIYAVQDHLIQVVMNALINAADAVTDGTGEVVITTREDDGGVRIVIADNGAGMSSEVLGRATDPFFTTKPEGKGTGLGLAVCKAIIDQHNGSLVIDSAPDKGTTVSIGIPTGAEGPVP